MRVAVFFIYLCLLLIVGNDNAYAGIYQAGTHYSHALSTCQEQQIKHTNSNQDYNVIKNTGIDKEEKYLLNDFEDEDTGNFFAKKCKLHTKCNLTSSYHSILIYLCNCFKAILSFSGQKSDIYILLRTLRL